MSDATRESGFDQARRPSLWAIPRVLAAEARESFMMAMGALVAHKLRSALTLVGVMVGVFSIIVVMTTMRAMEKDIEKNMSQLGGETFVVSRWPRVQFDGPTGWQKYRLRKRISLEQGMELVRRATLPRSIGLEEDFDSGTMTSRYAKAPPNVAVTGDTPGSFPAQQWDVEDGRALIDSDVDSQRDVCVLGNSLATNLFPHSSAVGEDVNFDGIKYTVVGVLESKGAMSGGREDNFAIIPITTGLTRYYQKQWIDINILVQAQSAADYDDTVDQVRGLLRIIRKVPPGEEDSFEIFSNDSVMDQIKSFTFKVRLGVSLISSIALLAAGIGIMNIMLVSVTERTREIGIRRAIGAKKRNIMMQFIMEAIVLCEVGGVIGVGLGIVGGGVAAKLMDLAPVIPVDWAVIGLAICSLVGIIFGTYPAHKAANLDPIESLRYE
jgi:putative ABC transport system permease protein